MEDTAKWMISRVFLDHDECRLGNPKQASGCEREELRPCAEIIRKGGCATGETGVSS